MFFFLLRQRDRIVMKRMCDRKERGNKRGRISNRVYRDTTGEGDSTASSILPFNVPTFVQGTLRTDGGSGLVKR